MFAIHKQWLNWSQLIINADNRELSKFFNVYEMFADLNDLNTDKCSKLSIAQYFS